MLGMYVTVLVLDYAKDETISIQATKLHIDFNHTISDTDQKTSVFVPTNETGWNLAFGFAGMEMPNDIGEWRVRYVARVFNTS